MHLLDLACVYAAFFFFGYWIYALAFRSHPLPVGWRLILAPIFGLSTIAIYSQNIIGLSIPFPKGIAAFAAVTALLDIVGLWLQRKNFATLSDRINMLARSPRLVLPYVGIGLFFAILFAIMLGPILGLPLTTPWRIGPDAAGYTTIASFLTHGDTLAGMSNQYNRPIDIYVYEFMLQTFRRSCAGVIAFMSLLFGKHPAELAFLATAFCSMLFTAVCFHLFSILSNEKNRLVSLLIAGAVALNCNLLSILYEGGYAQIMSMPILVAFVWLNRSAPLKEMPVAAACFIYGVMFAAISGIYLESIIVLPMLLGGLFALDILLQRKLPPARTWIIIVGSFLVGLALNFDVLRHWPAFEMENSKLVALAGWQQPRWALFPDIMGWLDIYDGIHGNAPNYTNKLPRLLHVFELGLSALAISFIGFALYRRSRAARLAIIPLFMIVAAAIHFRYQLKIHNYSYMKIYTLMLPFLTVGFGGCLLAVFGTKKGPWIVGSLSLLTMMMGCLYILDYRADYTFLSSGMLELQRVDSETDLKGFVVLSTPEKDEHTKIREIFMRSFFADKMIHPDFFPQQDFSASRNLPVALIVHRDAATPAYKSEDVLWRGSEYLLVNTHIPVEDAWANQKDIPWHPQPSFIPRPEIEMQWTWENARNGIAGKYSFAKFYDLAK